MRNAAPVAVHQGSAPDYRPAIDGLRAIAVLLVILYHYGVPGFHGGFVGVDVFFVISGFLIASRIDSDIRSGRFSLLTFFERRIRRIVPALFAMYALVLLAGELVLFPPDLRFLTRIGVYVIPFLANYGLYQNAGAYGGQFANQIVLLHTWSLAVEEQFYILFPLLMIAIVSVFRRRYAAVLWPLTLVSLAACIVAVRVSPTAAFYLAPFRAWELLGGALLALGKFSSLPAAGLRTGALLTGLALIGAADLLLSTANPYPGELTLVPCVGTGLILYAARNRIGLADTLLGNAIVRRIGQWSYSLYLYHWPLLLLVQYYAFDPLTIFRRCVLLAATFLMGALSWRYVEQPFRGPNAWLDRPKLFAVATAFGVALIGATYFIHRASDPRLYDNLERIRFPSNTAEQVRCSGTSPELTTLPPCILGDISAPINTVVWGDSHATAVLPATNIAYARHHEAAMLAEIGGCSPLVAVYVRDPTPGQSAAVRSWMDATGIGNGVKCQQHNDAVLNWIIQHRIATVILAGHWIANTEEQFSRVLTDAESPDDDSGRDNAEVFARGIERLLAVLQREHARVFVLDDVPGYVLSVPYELASARRLELNRELGISQTNYVAQQRSATQVFTRLQRQYRLHMLRPQDILCASGRCAIARGEAPFYVDGEHLSPTGALTIEPIFEAIFDPLSNRGN